MNPNISYKTYAGDFDEDVSRGYGLVSQYSYDALKSSYTAMWQGLIVTKPGEATTQAKAIINGKARLMALQVRTGVPWFVIGILIVREAGLRNGQLDWGACLHNGQRIIGTGRKTTLVPKGRGPFKTFEDAAVDALKDYAGSTWSPEYIGYTLEKFNGFGYRKHGIPSPYIVGGTNKQRPGKYVADGVYNANVMDVQVGGFAILKIVMSMDASASFDRQAKVATDIAEQPLQTSSINQGAAGVGTLGLGGVVSIVWDKMQYANDKILEAVTHAAGQPLFWILIACVALAAYIIYKRKLLRDQARPATITLPEPEEPVYEPAVMDTRRSRKTRVRVARQGNGRRSDKDRHTAKRARQSSRSVAKARSR